jgi:cell division septum initiation protein DivIVA
MLQQPQLSNLEPNHNGNNPSAQQYVYGQGSIDIQQELNRLEEIVLSSFRIPLSGRTLIDEEKLLGQLDFVRVSLPSMFEEALLVLEQKAEIIQEAEEYGEKIVEAAQIKRAQILAENDIIRHAEREADQLRSLVQQECEAMMQETLDEIDRQRRTSQQELEDIRQTAIAQATEIADGADEYADNVLGNIEQDIKEMLRIITNGRQQLRRDVASQRNSSGSKKR